MQVRLGKQKQEDAFQSSGLNRPQKTMTLMDICITGSASQGGLGPLCFPVLTEV